MVFGPPELGVIKITPRRLTGRNVAALAAAVSREAAHLGISRGVAGQLSIWGIFPGTTSAVCVRLKSPGRVILSLGHDNLAVFHRSDASLLLETDPTLGLCHGAGRAHCAKLIGEAFRSNHVLNHWVAMGALILMVAEAAREHRHGGTLLIVPHAKHESIRWLDLGDNKTLYAGLRHLLRAVVRPMPTVTEPLEALTKIPQLHNYMMGRRDLVNPEILRATEAIGTLSAIDGAVVLSQSLRLRAFGAMVREPQNLSERHEEIERRSVLDLERSEKVKIRDLGGARRRSAATFVANNYDCVAVTASQDGALSVAFWVGDEKTGHALLITDLENLLD